MPLEDIRRVTSEAIGRGKPSAAVRVGQQYLVDIGGGLVDWVTGDVLLRLPQPVKVTAIAWRL